MIGTILVAHVRSLQLPPAANSPDTVRPARLVGDKDSLFAQSSAAIPNRARITPSITLGGSRVHMSSAGISPKTIRLTEGTQASSWTSPSGGHTDEDTTDSKTLLDRFQISRPLRTESTSTGQFSLLRRKAQKNVSIYWFPEFPQG